MPLKVDPRVEPLFRGQPAVMRFLGYCFLAVIPPDKLDEVLAALGGGDVDWHEQVAGRPLYAWNGKTRAQLRKERVSEAHIKLIAGALKKRGMTLAEDAAAPTLDTDESPAPRPVVPVTPVPQLPAPVDPAQSNDSQGDVPLGTLDDLGDGSPEPEAPQSAPAAEPLYAGHPLAFYAGKSRKEVLAVDGVSPAAADKILKALADQPK